MDLSFFPPLNAALNGIACLFLILGFIMIKRGDRKAHARCMVAALVVSAVFLVSYVSSKVLMGKVTTRFPLEYPVARQIYLVILFTHIPLAIGMLPLIFIAVRRAVKGDLEGHRRMVKWAYPIWVYVSVTGVLVYFMLFQWFPPVAAAVAHSETSALAPAAEDGGLLKFEPEEFSYEASAEETEVTATFVARNTGSGPVGITKLDSSCSCLKVEADQLVIPPGESAMITAIFDIAKSTGDTEKRVYVTTDIPGSHEISLPVRISVPPVVSLDPAMITWALGGPPEAREVVFRVLRDKPIRILDAKSSRDSVTADLKTVEEGREYRITLKPESTGNILLGLVRITTDCELEQHRQHLLYYAVQDGEPAK